MQLRWRKANDHTKSSTKPGFRDENPYNQSSLVGISYSVNQMSFEPWCTPPSPSCMQPWQARPLHSRPAFPHRSAPSTSPRWARSGLSYWCPGVPRAAASSLPCWKLQKLRWFSPQRCHVTAIGTTNGICAKPEKKEGRGWPLGPVGISVLLLLLLALFFGFLFKNQWLKSAWLVCAIVFSSKNCSVDRQVDLQDTLMILSAFSFFLRSWRASCFMIFLCSSSSFSRFAASWYKSQAPH